MGGGVAFVRARENLWKYKCSFMTPAEPRWNKKRGGKGHFQIQIQIHQVAGLASLQNLSLRPAIWRDLSYGPFRGFSGFRRGCGFWKILDEAGN